MRLNDKFGKARSTSISSSGSGRIDGGDSSRSFEGTAVDEATASLAAAASLDSEAVTGVGVITVGCGAATMVGEGKTTGIAVACRTNATLSSAHPTATTSDSRPSTPIINLITTKLYQLDARPSVLTPSYDPSSARRDVKMV